MRYAKFLILVFIIFTAIGISFSSCSKKESGICYCSYYSGDKKHYDLRHLPKQEQIDTCNHLNELAKNFVGNCKLKK